MIIVFIKIAHFVGTPRIQSLILFCIGTGLDHVVLFIRFFYLNMAYAFKFNQVLKILGKERAATYLKEAFLSLLTDNSREVQKKIFSILHHIIGNFLL